jgi:hypothetical protein
MCLQVRLLRPIKPDYRENTAAYTPSIVDRTGYLGTLNGQFLKIPLVIRKSSLKRSFRSMETQSMSRSRQKAGDVVAPVPV